MTPMKIEVVSDVMCPWCVIGFKNLQQALAQLSDSIAADIEWHAFELNPQMPEQGQDMREHLAEKYGITPEQSRQNRDRIVAMGEQAGFRFNFADDAVMINSFNCHRLLYWAKAEGLQTELQMAMFRAHFTDNKRLNVAEELVALATEVGLNGERARAILDSDEYAAEVRAEQAKMHQYGINSVPTFIINGQYAINGGQPADVFAQALTQISEQSPT